MREGVTVGSQRPRAASAFPAASLVCAGCGYVVPAAAPFTPRCPAARPGDDVDHVLARRIDAAALAAGEPLADDDDPQPFVRYRRLFHAYHVARAAGWTDGRYVELVRSLDEAVAAVEGHGSRATPFRPAARLARTIGLPPRASLWVKDETGNVGGSHKARHLMGILIELRVAEALGRSDPARPLAIASCGNAALAAAIVARAAGRELRVFVPDAADPEVIERLRELGARVVVCPRVAGVAGDPSVRALDEALAAGAIPFTCQGDRDGFAIEGGATLGWEMAEACRDAGIALDRVVVQVGGGAFGSSLALAFDDALRLGWSPRAPRLDTVQTRGGWPLARAFGRLARDLGATPGVPVAAGPLHDALAAAARHRSGYMWPWETEPTSVAHGILDDETYDWLALVEAMLATGGRPLVVDEATLLDANEAAVSATGIPADETGTAGLAGLVQLARDDLVGPDETVAVVFSGVRRTVRPGATATPSDQAQTASRE